MPVPILFWNSRWHKTPIPNSVFELKLEYAPVPNTVTEFTLACRYRLTIDKVLELTFEAVTVVLVFPARETPMIP